MSKLRECLFTTFAHPDKPVLGVFHEWACNSISGKRALIELDGGAVELISFKTFKFIDDIIAGTKEKSEDCGTDRVSESNRFIAVEVLVPVEDINILFVAVAECIDGDREVSHLNINIDGCKFDIIDYDEDDINQLAFERWENDQ